ncbi:hypothetical protein AVP41_01893 [Microbacterium sp. TNHR37B]|nr:hypothetical protein AVP41_01893 [Microbacterium sp. TNHR37B]
MEFSDILLLVGGAVLGYLVQVVGERWRNVSDEYELWADARALSLEARGKGIGAELEYTWKGRSVQRPHLVDLYFWSAGKRDITSDQFDGGRSLEIRLGVPVVSELEGNKFALLDETAVQVDPQGTLVVSPSIIRKRMASHYRFITDGAPTLAAVNPIANLAAVRSVSADKRASTRLKRALGRVGSILIGVGIVGSLVYLFGLMFWGIGSAIGLLPEISTDFGRALTTWYPIVFFPVFLGGVLLAALSDTVSRRAGHALRVVRRSLGDKKALPWIK